MDETELILDLIEQMLKKQHDDIIWYMNECMTQNERTRHGDNIFNLLVRPEPCIAWIKLNLMANS